MNLELWIKKDIEKDRERIRVLGYANAWHPQETL